MKRTLILACVLVVAALLLMTGCSKWTGTESGALFDAGAGAKSGAVADNASGSTTRGAIISAAVGGVAGGVIARQMDQQARDLMLELPGATVERVSEGIQVTFPDELLYAFDSDDLSTVAREHLRALATSLAKYPHTRSLIVAHTDSKGTAPYDVSLSRRRAESAAVFLIEQGVDRGRLSTVGRGSNEPLATNDSAATRQQNRRVEVAIYADEASRRLATGN